MSEFDASIDSLPRARIVTLTSDLGIDSLYLASIKGAIISRDPSIRIVDICHAIRPFDGVQAAFSLRNTAAAFPPGTVHIISVNTMPTDGHVQRVMELGGQFYIGMDDGILSLIADKTPDAVYDITVQSESDCLTFPSLNVFVQVACHLISGGVPAVIGRQSGQLVEAHTPGATMGDDWIQGIVEYVDNFGNLISNIDETSFRKAAKGRAFSIPLRTSRTKLTRIKKSYSDAGSEGERVILFNHMGLLEIGIYKGGPDSGGGAAQLLGLGVGSRLRIEFSNPAEGADTLL
jgi:S-adenosylmethionine hydrolase